MHDAALDMRMNTSSPKSAYDVVNSYSCEELMRIFYDYGEEKWSKRIAEFICEKRKTKPIETTFELHKGGNTEKSPYGRRTSCKESVPGDKN